MAKASLTDFAPRVASSVKRSRRSKAFSHIGEYRRIGMRSAVLPTLRRPHRVGHNWSWPALFTSRRPTICICLRLSCVDNHAPRHHAKRASDDEQQFHGAGKAGHVQPQLAISEINRRPGPLAAAGRRHWPARESQVLVARGGLTGALRSRDSSSKTRMPSDDAPPLNSGDHCVGAMLGDLGHTDGTGCTRATG